MLRIIRFRSMPLRHSSVNIKITSCFAYSHLVNSFEQQHKSYHNNSEREYQTNSNPNYVVGIKILSAVVLIGGTYYYSDKHLKQNTVYADKKPINFEDIKRKHNEFRKDLPIFGCNEISKHDSMAKGVWVTYGIGVYDITKFIPEHPGSEKIMLAAGSAIDPFWYIFQQHNTPEILQILEDYRIGNLKEEDQVSLTNMENPWSGEPKRHPLLEVRSNQPFNAEPPGFLLTESFITPADFFYVRNHLPVPNIDIKDYELEVTIDNKDEHSVNLTYDDIRKFPKHTVTAAVMCGGNRRSEMARVKPIKGLNWKAAAVGNAEWSGARLCDILAKLNIKPNETWHVQFEGLDTDPTSTPYGASIPLTKALDERGDVLLAYEMNGQPLTRDHGFPVRVIVPGVVGARNVKWVGKIIVSPEESNSHWQQNDYKGFSPSTDWDTVDFSKAAAIQNMPVTSAITVPQNGDTVLVKYGHFIEVKGYAWSGGGSRIIRVDVTGDGGKTWQVAKLDQIKEELAPNGRHYGWTIWTAKIPVEEKQNSVEIWSKAVDSNYNLQPESFENIWNLRGVASNAYYKIKVNLRRPLMGHPRQ